MYSLVLMTAMTGAPDAAEFNGYFRDLLFGQGCSGSTSAGGCSGSYAPRYSCYGGGSGYPANCSGSAAYNSGCNGCNGCNGGVFSNFRNRVRSLFDPPNNCCGGSGSGYGCSGSGYGCGGSASAGYSCFGSQSYSCFGGPVVSYTPMMNGGLTCQGGMPMNAPAPIFDTYPTIPGGPPSSIPYAPPEVAPPTSSLNTGLRPAGYTSSSLTSNGNPGARATVVVKLPADARLYAETKPLALTGSERKFVSPELPAGQDFTYRFRAEYERDGETVSVTKKVAVRAGGTVAIEFTDLTAKIAPEKNAIAPAGGSSPVAAKPTGNPTGTGSTPALMPGNAASQPPVTPVTPPAPPASSAPERATITVKLPEGATLFVDDRKSPSSEPVRQFSTPPLPGGREFAYLMRAEVTRNGQTETFTQKVPFRAGERVEVDFTGVGR